MCYRHDWEIKDKTVLPSAYEQLVDSSGRPPSKLSADVAMFQKTVVLVLACKKCGKLKQITERGPVL